MARCKDGYELTVVRCPKGCGGPPAAPSRASRPRSKGRLGRQGRHSGLVDMTGKQCGTWVVLGPATNLNGNARWLCRHTCGAESIQEGIRLRSKPPVFCDSCRGTRSRAARSADG